MKILCIRVDKKRMKISVAQAINVSQYTSCHQGYDELKAIHELEYLTYYIAGMMTSAYNWVVTRDNEQFLDIERQDVHTLPFLLEKTDSVTHKNFWSQAQLGMDDSSPVLDLNEKFEEIVNEFLKGKTILDMHSCIDFLRKSLGAEVIKKYAVI